MQRFSYRDRDYAFGQVMLTLRTAIGLTQAGLADYLGVSRRAVGEWEAGNKYPKPEHLKRFISLVVKHEAFPAESKEEEIRALWQVAHQKVLLDEVWLASLLHPQPALALQPSITGAGAPSVVPIPSLSPLPASALPAQPVDNGHHTRGAQGGVINLPFQPTAFFGRAAELTEISKILSAPACRLLTLLGPGGVGKTRLAIEVAEGQIEEFTDGVVFVTLASVSTPSQIVPALGEALSLSFAGQPDPTAYLLRYLRSRHMLLLLDNFEHLLGGADLVFDILERAPQVTILVTSRERLNLQAEWLFDVQGLSYPPAFTQESRSVTHQSVADLTNYSAVQLLIQRATQVRPGFPLNESTLLAVVRICQHVAGMPLAIELAASGVRTLPVTEIEQQIHSNLDILATTLRDVPARHRSMRAVIDHSWNLLNETERALFSKLAVFRDGCAGEAAKEVAGATLSGLATLVDKSLLRQSVAHTQNAAGNDNPDAALAGAEEDQRFFLLEPIREYALEKLIATHESEAVQYAHASYYMMLAESAVAQWDSPAADTVIEQLDREYDNIRAAFQWTSAGGDLTIGLRLGIALRRFWQLRGYYSEGRVWLEDLLAREHYDQDPAALAVRARAIHTAAWLATDQHDYARAKHLFEQSRQLRRALGETEDDTHLLAPEAREARSAGDYRRALALREDAVARHRALGDRGGMGSGGLGNSLYELALVVREQGDFERATALFEECLALHRELGARDGIAVGLMGLGDIARDKADPARVRDYCERTLVICRELGLQWALGFLLNNLALAAYLDNDLPQAASLIDESVALFRAQQADSSLGEVLITQGHILMAQRDLPGAYAAMTEALGQVLALGPRLMVVLALEGLAGLVAQLGATETAVQVFAAASTLRVQMGTPARPLDRILQTGELANARSILGVATWEALWEAGERLPLDEVGRLITGVAPPPRNLAGQAPAAPPAVRPAPVSLPVGPRVRLG